MTAKAPTPATPSQTPRWVVVRTGPFLTTYHLSHLSLLPLQEYDSALCGCTPLTEAELVHVLEERRPWTYEGHGRTIEYRVEPLSP